jgi:hypothetical protein
MNLIEFEEHLVRVRSLRDALAPMLTCAQDLEEPSSAISTAIFLTDELRDALEQLENSARAGSVLSPAMAAAEIVGAPVQQDPS